MFSDRGACKVSMVLEYLDMDLYRLMRSHPQLLPANPALVKVRGDFCSTLSTLSLCHSVTLSLCHSVTLSSVFPLLPCCRWDDGYYFIAVALKCWKQTKNN